MKELSFLNGDVIVPIDDGAVGVTLSGGPNSTLLLYILMANLEPTQELRIYTTGLGDHNYRNIGVARAVVAKASELTGFTNYTHYVDTIDTPTFDAMFATTWMHLETKHIGTFYAGLGANPPNEVVDAIGLEFPTPGYTQRSPDIIRVTEMEWHGGTARMPIWNHNKADVLAIYDELGIRDSLYSLTESCESTSPIDVGRHCGECYCCKEREWSLS